MSQTTFNFTDSLSTIIVNDGEKDTFILPYRAYLRKDSTRIYIDSFLDDIHECLDFMYELVNFFQAMLAKKGYEQKPSLINYQYNSTEKRWVIVIYKSSEKGGV